MEFVDDLGKPWRWEEEDGTIVTRTAAWSPPGCHCVACGLKLYVKDGKLQRVEGDENQPITQGRLCIRCLTMTDYVYHPDRVIYPMKRDPKDRGKNTWERITMDEALALIAEKAKEIKAKYGPESIITFTGTGRQGGGAGSTGAYRSLGTCNNAYTQSGYACYAPRVCSTGNLLGAAYPEIDYAGGLVGRFDDPAYTLPEVIVMWGKEPLPSNGDGFFGHAIIDMMRRGSKLISVDPRVNWLATRATYHLRLRCGTDTALAMAMLNIIITEDLYDHDFVELWTYGFEELAKRVAEMPVERAAEICGIPAEEIVEATRMYANAKPACISWGLAIDQHANGVQAGQAILGLMAITGNVDVPGGQLLLDITDGIGDAKKAGKGWDKLSPELQKKIIGIEDYPLYVAQGMQAQADQTLDCLETDYPYPLRMGWIVSTNMLAPTNSAQPMRWEKALQNLEFCFATDIWITPTIMACCDLVLPLAAFPEGDACVQNHYGASANIMGAINKAYQVGECKSDMEYMLEIGRAVCPENWAEFETLEDWINAYGLAGLSLKYSDFKKEVYRRRTVSYYKYKTGHLRPDGQPGFNTRTGRLELWSTVFKYYGEDPLPYYEEPRISPVSTPEIAEEYPLILTTGAREYAYFHSEGRQIPLLRETCPEPLVEINPKTAEKLGIRNGDWVYLENPFGSCTMVAKLTPTVDEKTVMAQHGWWFPEEDGEAPHLFGTYDHNINNLVPHGKIGKLGFGADYKCLLCKVEKITDGVVDGKGQCFSKAGEKTEVR